MSEQITSKHLQAACDALNRISGSPMVPYVGNVSQKDNYHMSYAYGGASLHRMAGTGGATHSPCGGHYPKREMYMRILAFTAGIQSTIIEAA